MPVSRQACGLEGGRSLRFQMPLVQHLLAHRVQIWLCIPREVALDYTLYCQCKVERYVLVEARVRHGWGGRGCLAGTAEHAECCTASASAMCSRSAWVEQTASLTLPCQASAVTHVPVAWAGGVQAALLHVNGCMQGSHCAQ